MDLVQVIQIVGPIAGAFLSVPLIQAIVKIAREAGLPTKFAPLLSIVIGFILGLLVAYLVTLTTTFAPAVLYIYGGFLGIQAGAGAAGFYDAAKFIGEVTTTTEG